MGLEDNPFAASLTESSPWADPDDLNLLKADLGARFIGRFIDNFLSMLPFAFMFLGVPLTDDPMAVFLIGTFGFFGGLLLCYVPSWYFIATQGQSLGKMAVGTRIVRTDGSPVDFVRGVIIRDWVVGAANIFLSLFGLSFLGLIDAVFIFGNERKCGHDMLADTIVVQANAWNPYQS
jgi:uncharacterized RDD family membrane protein YckC